MEMERSADRSMASGGGGALQRSKLLSKASPSPREHATARHFSAFRCVSTVSIALFFTAGRSLTSAAERRLFDDPTAASVPPALAMKVPPSLLPDLPTSDSRRSTGPQHCCPWCTAIRCFCNVRSRIPCLLPACLPAACVVYTGRLLADRPVQLRGVRHSRWPDSGSKPRGPARDCIRFGDLLDDRRHSFLEPFLGWAFYRPVRRVCSQCGGNACCMIPMTAGQEDSNSSQWNMGHTGVYNYMGYTMRTAGWRFTVWLPFDNSNATVIWPEQVDMGER